MVPGETQVRLALVIQRHRPRLQVWPCVTILKTLAWCVFRSHHLHLLFWGSCFSTCCVLDLWMLPETQGLSTDDFPARGRGWRPCSSPPALDDLGGAHCSRLEFHSTDLRAGIPDLLG